MCHESPVSTEAAQQKTVRETERPRSHLFMVRVWIEDLGGGHIEWRGQVKYVISGEVRYFREWKTLVNHMLAMSSFHQESIRQSYREPEIATHGVSQHIEEH